MPLSAQEFAALQALAQYRRESVRKIFKGSRMVFTNEAILKVCAWNAKNLQSIITQTGKAKKAILTGEQQGASQGLVSGVFDTNDLKSLTAGCDMQIVKEVTNFVDAIPGVSQLVGGVACIRHLAKACKKAWEQVKVLEKAHAVRGGDPRNALLGVQKTIELAEKEDLGKFGINATHVAVSGALLAADGGVVSGPATAALKAMASLAFRMWLVARDLRFRKNSNEWLKNPDKITLQTSSDCPVLCCYYLTEAGTSDIANFMIADLGLPGWMDKIEALMPDIVYTQKKAAGYIRKSRIQLEGLQTDYWKHLGKGKWKIRGYKAAHFVKSRLGLTSRGFGST